jgi:hypothetical protein
MVIVSEGGDTSNAQVIDAKAAGICALRLAGRLGVTRREREPIYLPTLMRLVSDIGAKRTARVNPFRRGAIVAFDRSFRR